MSKSKEEVKIVIDSREQQPYEFSIASMVAALPAGDYSIVGYEQSIAIERKSLNDYVQSVIRSRDRFNRELEKLTSYISKCIVVEASWDDVIFHRYTSEATPASVIGATMSIIIDSDIPVYFLSNRQIARSFVQGYLIRFAEKVSKTCQQHSINSDNPLEKLTEKAIKMPDQIADQETISMMLSQELDLKLNQQSKQKTKQRKQKTIQDFLPAELIINRTKE